MIKQIIVSLISIVGAVAVLADSTVPRKSVILLQQQYLYPQTVYDYRITYIIIGLIIWYIYNEK